MFCTLRCILMSFWWNIVLLNTILMQTNAQQYFDAVRSDQPRCLQSIPFAWMVVDCMLLLCKPPVMPWYSSQLLAPYFKLLFIITFNCDCILSLCDYFQWSNGSDTSVIVIVFLCITPSRYPRSVLNLLEGNL